MRDSEPMPKSLGELFSDATALMRAHLAPVVILSLPFVAVELMLRESASALFATVRRAIGADTSDLASALPTVVTPFLMAALLFVVSRVVVQGAVACATVFTRQALDGEVLSPNAAIRQGLRFLPRVAVSEFLYYVILFVAVFIPAIVSVGIPFAVDSPAMVLVMLPVACVWMLVVAVTLFLRFALAPQLIVLEGAGPLRALLRSADLMRPNGARGVEGPKFRLSILLLVYWALASSIQGTFLIPVLIIGVAQGLPLSEMPPPLTAIPLLASIPLAVLQVIGNSVVLPLAGLLPTLFYRDILVRLGAPVLKAKAEPRP